MCSEFEWNNVRHGISVLSEIKVDEDELSYGIYTLLHSVTILGGSWNDSYVPILFFSWLANSFNLSGSIFFKPENKLDLL